MSMMPGLLLGVAAVFGDEEVADVTRVEVALARSTGEHVGRAVVDLEGWRAAAPEVRERFGCGDTSLETVLEVHGRPVVLVADREKDERPARLIMSRGDGGEPLRVLVPWRDAVPDVLAHARLELGDGDVGLFLSWYSDALSGKWYEGAAYAATFAVDGIEQAAWFLDGDLDGTLAGPRDRWIAGPTSHLERLSLHNPHEEMRPLDEAWCLGARRLRLVAVSATAATIEAAPPDGREREEALARHYERVQTEFTANLPTRTAMLEKQGDDPARAVAAAPVQWYFAHDLDEALAVTRERGRPLLVEFTSFSCSFCRLLTYVTHPDAEVVRELDRFACVKIVAEVDPDPAWKRLGVDGFPCTAHVDGSSRIVERIDGFVRPSAFAAAIREWAREPPPIESSDSE